MAVKHCSIENCSSSTSRSEDIGVTYHKYPKERVVREAWMSVTRQTCNNVNNSTYVCSRHFCKSDFKTYQDSKYVLKPVAVPSIFSWIPTNIISNKMDKEPSKEASVEEQTHNVSTSSKESEEENVEAIQKYLDKQGQNFQNKKNENEKQKAEEIEAKKENTDTLHIVEQGETMMIGKSVMEMILTESEAKIQSRKEMKPIAKQSLSPKGNSVALSVGSKVEAKDFADLWYPAIIIEVDYDEMEVLVHYENISNKHDEWININSPRLRPICKTSTPSITSVVASDTKEPIKEESMVEDNKLKFVVGERCLARWRDNRRFIATIANDLGKGIYEVIFDDGFHWKCNTSRLYKLKKESGKHSVCLSVDTSMPPKNSTPSPVPDGSGPSSGIVPNPNLTIPIFHTHLFDPTRDYLGSKSERREMKRKLNIKEIFNIGQKKRKKPKSPDEKVERVVKQKKPRVLLKKLTIEPVVDFKNEVEAEIKSEIPDAVASIIGTVTKEDDNQEISDIKMEIEEDVLDNVTVEDKPEEAEVQEGSDKITLDDLVDNNSVVSAEIEIPSDFDLQHSTLCLGSEIEEEMKLENFEKPDDSKNEVIEKMKEVINKLEDGLNKMKKEEVVDSPKPEVKIEPVEEPEEEVKPVVSEVDKKSDLDKEKLKKKLSKMKKSKKLRLLQEKKVKKQVEKVKSELEEMKRQVEEMKQQMRLKAEELASPQRPRVMPESFLLPGEWCCKWVNGQPVGTVSEIEGDCKVDINNKLALPRRTVQVEDKRLPEGWTKHMIRRRLGQSAGKWDVVLVSPSNHRFHTKNDVRSFLEQNQNENWKPYEHALLDFGVHLKLSRRMGWISTVDGAAQTTDALNTLSPLAKTKKYRVIRSDERKEKKKRKRKYMAALHKQKSILEPGTSGQGLDSTEADANTLLGKSALEDGYVYVGSLKVQILENNLRCPAEGCYKNFRNGTLLQMHIKHYHRELRKMLGAAPKVLDLAKKRTKPKGIERKKSHAATKVIKIKIKRPPKRTEEPKKDVKVPDPELNIDMAPTTPTRVDIPIPRSQDSPKLRQALANKPVKRPKVLLPVRRSEPPEPVVEEAEEETPMFYDDDPIENEMEAPIEVLDFETEISTHTVTKPYDELRRKSEKKRVKCFSTISKRPISEDEEAEERWNGMNSDLDTRSSFPGSDTPDSKTMEKVPSLQQVVSSESAEDQKDSNMYVFTESGERIKIEHMKREEIINCHCGFREEDGLMVQCELCLCWQHALCHNIQRESEVPEKYTCSICLNPKRGRRSKRFLHDQDRIYEGLLPGAKPCESLRRSHELSGNLLRIQDALHALRVKNYVATKKDHPKLYLWAKDWENAEINFTQERLNSDYSDLNIIINSIGKENLPVKSEEVRDPHLDMRTLEELDHERFSQRDSSNSLLNMATALSSPSGTSLDLPITTSELERLAKSVQEQEVRNVAAPQPEAAIENSACRERLLRHVQRCQALLDARLDSIEAQVAELESQDPLFEDDETADYFPRTKQTVQMLMRDLDTMEELGIIT